MQSAGKMQWRRAATTRRNRCGRQNDGGGQRQGRYAIIDAKCAIMDEMHAQPRSISALDVIRMHVPVAH